MSRTYVILDGLTDPLLARRLSSAWASAGFDNAVDASGQRAWIAPKNKDEILTEPEAERAAQVARAVGIEMRDRAGTKFKPDNDPLIMGRQIVYEYRSRFATALVYGLPALALHYLAPILASGGGREPRDLVYPWLFELLLGGWVILAAGWPLLWQGLVSLIHLRMTSDLFFSLLVIAAYVPSALGMLSMPLVETPWLMTVKVGGVGPMFHVTVIVTILATLQRWLAHAAAWDDFWGKQAVVEDEAATDFKPGALAPDSAGEVKTPIPKPEESGAKAPGLSSLNVFKLGIGGNAHMMLAGLNAMLWFWIVLCVVAFTLVTIDPANKIASLSHGWRWALALAMIMPPMVGLAGINRPSPGWSALLPIFAFAGFLMFGSGLTGRPVAPIAIEVAGGFALLMSLVMSWGWRGVARR